MSVAMSSRATILAACLTVLVAGGLTACHHENPVEPTCVVTLDPASQAFTSAGGTGTVAVSAASSCTWSATAGMSWATITSGASGTGPGVVTYTIALNAADAARSGSIVIGGQAHRVTQDGLGSCAYDVSPLSLSFQSGGGEGTVTVSTTAACAWTATAVDSWITVVNGASGQGPGVVTVVVASYAGAATRTGVVRVAGEDVQVTQAAPGCSFVVSPQSAAFSADGGEATVNVAAPFGCAWSASASDSWLTILQGSDGQGDGAVRFAAARLESADARVGAIHVAGVVVQVVQSGDVNLCQYSVAPVSFSPCMPATTLTVSVNTGASCPWTVTAGASWLDITSGGSGTGSGAIVVSAGENYDPPRSGVVMVRWPAPTQGQNVQVAQAGCVYAVSKTAITFGAAGGSDSFDVLQQSDPITCGGPLQDACVWSATTDVPWITVTSPVGNSRGDNPVHFMVAPNSTGAGRTGTIRVRDRIVTIMQSGS